MDSRYFRLGFGPMSTEIIDIMCDYTVDHAPLMMIASRNQVDAESGYVKTTPQLSAQLKQKSTDRLLVCRDHCGPYFLDSEKGLSLADAVAATKKTIAYDIEQGFDLIHIDTSRVDDTYGVAEDLIKFCLDLNPNIWFEFGTEENVGVVAGAVKYRDDVAFARQFPNMQFVVAQTGSLCYEDKQAGGFDVSVVKDLVAVANTNGVKLKEHNADYLTAEQIKLRHNVGVHALNIAPQLGVYQTKLARKFAHQLQLHTEWNRFADVVINSSRWKKWTDSKDPTMQVNVAGHYCFNSTEYRNLIDGIVSEVDWHAELQREIYAVFDLYTQNI